MPSLLDIIRGQQAGLAGTQAPTTNYTQQAGELLRGKSGRSVGQPLVTSNLGEQSAGDATQAQLGAQAPQIAAQSASQDIAARRQELDTQQQSAALTQARKFDTAENKLRTQQLLSGLARDKSTLDLDKDRSRLEQTAFLLSMQDKQYVANLQDVGKRQRLDDAGSFRAEQERLAFGSSLDLLKDKLRGQDLLSVSDSDYRRLISSMSVQEAQQIASLEIQDMRSKAATEASLARTGSNQQAALSGIQAQSQGLQGLIKGATQAAAAYKPGTVTDEPLEAGK